MLGRPVTGRAAPAGAGQAGPARDAGGASGPGRRGCRGRRSPGRRPAARSCHLRSLGRRRGGAWRVCQAASSSAWMAAWTASSARRRMASGVPHRVPSPSRLPGRWGSPIGPRRTGRWRRRSRGRAARCRRSGAALMFTMPPQASSPALGVMVGRRGLRGRPSRWLGWRCTVTCPTPKAATRWCRAAAWSGSSAARSVWPAAHQATSWQTGQRRRAAAALAAGLGAGGGELEPTGGAGGDPDAMQQVQGRLGPGSGRVGSMGASEGPHFLWCARPGRVSSAPASLPARGSEGRVVVELAGLACRCWWRARAWPWPTCSAGADLFGLDLDHGAALPLGGLPGAGPELANDDHPVALGQRVADVLGELPPGGDPVEAGVAVASSRRRP